jgi:hypothetical protein
MLGSRSIVYRWREPAVQAAIVNAAMIVIVPVAWLWYVDYTSEVVRSRPTSVWLSGIQVLPVLLACGAIAPLIAWRTYVHARAYRVRKIAAVRGPLEVSAIAGAMALVLMLGASAQTWGRRPAPLIVAYIAAYVIGTALVGLLIALVFAATALMVLHVRGVHTDQ